MKINLFGMEYFFFGNRSVKQTIFKNTFWLGAAEAASRFLTFFLFIYVARILGATEYGKFSFALAIMYLFNIIYGLVSSQIITREISQEIKKEKDLSAIISLNIFLGCLATFLMIAGSFFITSDLQVRKVMWILAFYNFVSSFFTIIWAFLRAREKMEYESFMKVLQAFALTVFGFIALIGSSNIEDLSYAYLFSSLLSVGLSLIFFHLKIYPLSISWDKRVWKRVISFSWPLALAAIFSTLYTQMDSVMMGKFGQITQTGWYNAAQKIVLAALVPITLVSTSFYPVLCKAFKESKEKFQQIWNYQMTIMIVLALPLVAGGMLLAPKIIDFLYDETYFPSIFALQILILMTGAIFLANPFQQGLIVANQQKNIFYVVALGALINFVLNLILIPEKSLYGASLATVITSIAVLVILAFLTLKHTSINPFNSTILLSLAGSGISSLAMYGLISRPFIYNLHAIFSIPIGAISYFASLILLKFIIKLFTKNI